MMMQEKENALQAWKTESASVRKHDQMIAHADWPMTRCEEIALGALFTAVSLVIVLLAGIA